MKIKLLAAAVAALIATPFAQADAVNEWGYWDSTGANARVDSSAAYALALNNGVRYGAREDKGSNGVGQGNLPTTIVQDFKLPDTAKPPVAGIDDPNLPSPDKWFGYAALESGSPAGAYDDNAYLLVGSDWVYGTIPTNMTFRIAGEDMNSVTSGTPTDYVSWRYGRDSSNTGPSYVHVNEQIPFPTDVPMTIGHWHKGSQTYYTIVGSATQLSDLQALASGPVLSYSGSSMGGSLVNLSVNFASSTWTGNWTANPSASVTYGSASTTPSFSAAGTISGAKIESNSITGVTNLDAAASFVKGTFYGNNGAVVGGLTVIKTDTINASDLFVACKDGVAGCGIP